MEREAESEAERAGSSTNPNSGHHDTLVRIASCCQSREKHLLVYAMVRLYSAASGRTCDSGLGDYSVEIAALDTRGHDPDGHPSLVRRTKRIGVLPEVLLRQTVDLLVRTLVDERRSPAH
jgi:hypothetical protein